MKFSGKIQKIKKRLISVVLTASMLTAFMPMLPVIPETTASAAANIQLGTYIKMGNYNGKDIVWRCVGFQKISGSTIQSTDFATSPKSGYLPLMYADTSICQKAFDGKGTTGTHARVGSRANYGSNYWGYSSIRAWLNSSASAGNVVWPESVPNSSNVSENPYDKEKGFMNSFKSYEKGFIKSVSQKEVLTDYDKVDKSTGSAVHTYTNSIADIMQNYTSVYAKYTTDSIFLPDVRQLKAVYDNRSILGNNYYMSRGADTSLLRTPYAPNGCYVRIVDSTSGGVGYRSGYYGTYGIRPAFFLDAANAVVISGSGTSDSPYVIGKEPTLSVSDKTMTYGSSASALSVSTNSSGTRTYSSSNTSVATVSSSGMVTPLHVGTATITVNVAADTTNGYASKSATCTVTISKATPSYTAPTAMDLTYNEGYQPLIIGGTSASGTTMQYRIGTSGSWTGTAPVARDAGTYTVYYQVIGNSDYNNIAAKSINVTIKKATPRITAPSARILRYSGNAQQLVNAGSTSGGTMQYRLDSGSWSANIPTATNADTYTVGYKVDVAEQTVSVTIAGEDSRLTSRPTAKNLTYNGNKQELVNAGTATGGTLQYRVGETGEWLSSIPIARDAGTYTVYYKVKGDANHNDTLEDSLTVTIAKANSQITKVPEAKTNLVATGSEQELVSAGTVTGGTMQYRLGLTGEWTTEIPKAVAGGEYTVYYRVLENINYNGLNGGNITVRIGKSESEMTADKKVVTYDDTVSLTVNVQRKAISTFAADNQVEFYVLEGLQYLGGATVQYTDGVNGTATITGIKINKSRFKIGENKIKVIYGGGVSLGASESEEIIVEVKPKEIGLTWENVLDRTYNGNPSNAAATATKLAEGDTVNVTVTGGDATNAGTHTATAAALTGPDAGYYKLPEANTQDYRIVKAEPVIDLAPVGLTGLMCNDAPQQLIISGTVTGGTIEYRFKTASADESAWSEWTGDVTQIKATAADDYVVEYRVVGDENHNDMAARTLEAEIIPGVADIELVPQAISGITYNGVSQVIITAGRGANNREMRYAAFTKAEADAMNYSSTNLPDDSRYTANLPEYTLAGTYKVYYMVAGDNDAQAYKVGEPITVVIAKADVDVAVAPEVGSDVVHVPYHGTLRIPVTVQKRMGAQLFAADIDEVRFYLIEGADRVEIGHKMITYDDPNIKITGTAVIDDINVTKRNFKPGENIIEADFGGNVNVNATKGNRMTVIVDPVDVSIKWSGNEIRTYDRTESNIIATAGLRVIDDDVKIAVSNGTQSSAGTHTAVATELTGAHAGFYKLPDDEAQTTCQYTIEKAPSAITAEPAARELTYNGSKQQLLEPGAAENGIMMYTLADPGSGEVTGEYSPEVPELVNAGTYKILYKVQGNDNYNDIEAKTIDATMEKADPEVAAPRINAIVYNGEEQDIVTPGETSGGTMMYKLDGGEYTTEIPTVKSAGSYTLYYKVTGDNNYNDAAEERIDVTVANADSIVSTEYAVNVTYNDVLTLEATVSTAGNNGIQTYAAKEQVEFEANGFIIGSGSVTYNNESKTTGKVTVRNIQVNKTRFKPGRNVVTARYGGTVNINESNDNQIIVNVNPIELNITWSDYDTRVYNGLENNVSASISGVLEDDVVNVEVENGTAVHAGQYTATAKLVGAEARYYKLPDDASTQPYEILKADIEITKVPEANTLTYTGQAQELVTAGEVSNGKIVYKVGENGEYSDMLPSVTDAGNYKVYYMADGGTNYKDSEEKMIDVSIAKADPTVQAPTAAKTLVYNGAEQELISAGSTNGGKMLYKLGRTGEYSESIPKAIDAANYTVYYMVEGDDNYNAAEEQSITVTMAKADSQVTADATDIQYQDTLELTVKVSLRNSDISTYALYDTVQFYIGEDMTPLRQANVEYTNEANTEGTARLSVKVNKTNNFVLGENIITVEYGGSVNINGSDDNTIIVNVTPMQLGIEWSNYETRPYDGEASNVTAVITGAAKTDKVELEVTGGNKINAGVHSATAALVGDDSEFYTLSDENSYQMYEITKIDPEYIIPTGVTAEYGQLLSGVRLPDGWSWEDGSQDVGEIGEHTFKAVYTPEDSENYNVISDVDIVVSVISGRDYTITDIANAEEDGFVDVSVIKNTQANGVLIVSSYSPEGILIGVRAVNINGITGEIPETDTVKVELRPQDGGYMSAYVWSSLVGMTPLSGKFSK